MRKLVCPILLSLTLGLGGCTGLELFMVGSALGIGGASYGKPWLDKYLTPESAKPPGT